MTIDPRHMAFSLIESAQKPLLTLDRAVEEAKEQLDQMDRKDRNLCNAIVFGVFRHRGRIDHYIRHCSKIPFNRMDPYVKTILRLGVFQIVFLDRVPDFAAIHTSIELAKLKTGKKASGFINAVLRNVARTHETIDLPSQDQDIAAHLEAACSIPAWLGQRWEKRYGNDKALMLGQTLMELPKCTLRINPLKTSRDALIAQMDAQGIKAFKTGFSSLGITVELMGHGVTDLPGFSEGFFQIQDEAAQLAAELLGARPGDKVLDACAGLGTKSFHTAFKMDNTGEVTANDTVARKAGPLETEADRLGIDIIRTSCVDMTRACINDFSGYFDRVLVDAPCSGLGVLARNPDTRWKRKPKDLARMAALQKKILNGAANVVAPGGVLVYAVCSCEPEETVEVVDHFLNKRKDYLPDPEGFENQLPFFCNPDSKTFYRATYPNHTGMDGFFMARIKRGTRR